MLIEHHPDFSPLGLTSIFAPILHESKTRWGTALEEYLD